MTRETPDGCASGEQAFRNMLSYNECITLLITVVQILQTYYLWTSYLHSQRTTNFDPVGIDRGERLMLPLVAEFVCGDSKRDNLPKYR
jgi:hypothetical protein